MKTKKSFKQHIEVVELNENIIVIWTTSGNSYEFKYADAASAEKAYKSLNQKTALELD